MATKIDENKSFEHGKLEQYFMNFLLEAIKLLYRGCPSGLQTQHSFLVDTNASYIIGVKGQIMSESIYEIMDF